MQGYPTLTFQANQSDRYPQIIIRLFIIPRRTIRTRRTIRKKQKNEKQNQKNKKNKKNTYYKREKENNNKNNSKNNKKKKTKKKRRRRTTTTTTTTTTETSWIESEHQKHHSWHRTQPMSILAQFGDHLPSPRARLRTGAASLSTTTISIITAQSG